MQQEFDFKSNKFGFVLATVFFIVALPTFLNIASCLETKYFPVVENINITEMTEMYNGHLRVSGDFERNRECSPLGLVWYIKEKEVESPIPVARNVVGENRPEGKYAFGPWELWTNKKDLYDYGYAVTYHKCHPFYTTKSIIFAKGEFK